MRIEDYMLSRTFIEVPFFTKRWKEIGLTDEELTALQLLLLKDPQSGPVMEGTGGIRKVRFPLRIWGQTPLRCHGGQWRYYSLIHSEWRGLYSPSQGFFPKYSSGIYGNMIVSRGLANTSRIPRIFNEPEIVFIRPYD